MYAISNQLHENNILLVNFSKNIKHGISENMSEVLLFHTKRDGWTDMQMERLVVAASNCFAKAPKHYICLNTSLKISSRS